MSRNRMIWIALESIFYLLMVFLILDFINLTVRHKQEKSISTLDEINMTSSIAAKELELCSHDFENQ